MIKILSYLWGFETKNSIFICDTCVIDFIVPMGI